MIEDRVSLTGLRIGAAQTLGAFSLVPVLRDHAPGDLRIAMRRHPSFGMVQLEDRPEGLTYSAYIPHGLVIQHSNDGSAVARATALGVEPTLITLHHRMVRAEKSPTAGTSRFRLLPLHLAFEGFLAEHFRGPDILWPEYSRRALRDGLDPRSESATSGVWLRGFDDALRLFEIHEDQVGMLVFVAGALAAANVLSHPADYRAMHHALLEDFYGELILQYALLHDGVRLEVGFDSTRVRDLHSLRAEVERVRAEHAANYAWMASGLLEQPVRIERVRSAGAFVLERFLPTFDPREEECHLGERIVRRDGTLEYLKTYRLSAAQVRRGYLLGRLAACDWHFETAMRELGATRRELVSRLTNAGLGYLIHPSILRGSTLA